MTLFRGIWAYSDKPFSLSVYIGGRSFGIGRGRLKRRDYRGQLGLSGAAAGRVWFLLLRR